MALCQEEFSTVSGVKIFRSSRGHQGYLRPKSCHSSIPMKTCYSFVMHARAVLSLLLAFALAVAPLVSGAAMCAAAVPAHGVHDGSATSAGDVHAAHASSQVETDTPASGCMDHGQCKGSCAAHCMSLPVPTVQASPGAKPIQASQVAALGPTFAPDTPSRPPQTVL